MNESLQIMSDEATDYVVCGTVIIFFLEIQLCWIDWEGDGHKAGWMRDGVCRRGVYLHIGEV